MRSMPRTPRLFAVTFLFLVVGLFTTLVMVQGTASAAQVAAPGGGSCGKPRFLGLEPWYQYLPLAPDVTGTCSVVFPKTSTAVLGSHSPFLLIALAILDDLIRVATLVAVGYVIYGGFQYTTSNGSPDGTRRAQATIINALVGVVIAILAVSIVGFLGNKLGG